MAAETPELQTLEEAVATRLASLEVDHERLVTELATNSLAQARCKTVLSVSARIRQLTTIPSNGNAVG